MDFERAPTGGGSWTTIATDSTPGDGFQASFDTTSVSDGHYDFRTVAYDVAGNQAAATPVTDRLVDNTPPDATISSPGAYLRGAVNLTSSTSDPGGSNASGVVTVAYEYSTNGGSTWQSTGSNFNSSAVPDGNVDLRVVATDAAGNVTASAPVTSFVDNTKPSTTDNAPSGWQSTPVTVTLNPNDGGSGVNVTEYSVDGNPSYTVGTSVVIPAPADGSNDGSHTIAYFSVDNAGNIETIKSTTVLIDATPPTCASCSAADYLRGTVDLSADPDTTGSGIKSVTFEYTDAGGSTWTAIGTDTTGPGPYTASWDTTPVPDGHYDLRILITDNADNVTTTDLPDKVVDNTAPDVALVGAPTEGQLVSGTIGIAASASDATSPVASVKFYVRGSLLGTDSTAPFSLNWNTTTGADGGATIQVVVEDMAGNTTTSAVRNVSVDNVSPTPTLADPGQYLNGTVSLSASSDADTTQVDFERRTAGGGSWVTIASDTTTPWGTSLDTTALADGLYDFRAIATDATGHTGTSPIRANVRVDNTSPAGSLTSPAGGATVGGPSVTLSGSYSDAGSGIASVRYELRPTGGGSWTTIATSTSAPFSATWDATTVASGSYDLQPVLTDRAGNTFTGAMRTITVDVSAPTVVLANPGATISGSVTLNATVTGSGATQVAFATSPAGGASWSSVGTDTSAPWSATFNTSLLPDGVYDIRATVSDSLGNTSFDTVTSIRVDNTAPRVVSSTPAEGSTVSSANAIGLVTSEPATPLNVTLDGGATVAPVVSGTHIDFGTGTLSPGAHTLSGELQDSSGKRAPFRVHFTVWSPSGSSLAPPVNKNTSAATSTTVESADGFAAATMPAGAWSTSGADWLILRITPVAAPSGLTNGFGSGPEALDVTARWALAGTEVHQFTRPIGILMRTTEKGLVPATFENGQWRVIARVPSAGTLPAGWDDGFWTDGAGFHLLTRHLSVFALLHDLQAPNAPQNVRGYLGPTGLTLRWTPGSDNSGTYDFVTVFSDSTDTGHYGVDYTTASIGSWSVGDPRIFRLKETDLAGNESALTRPLRPVPSLIGKTPDQVAALLAPLGLSVGTHHLRRDGPRGHGHRPRESRPRRRGRVDRPDRLPGRSGDAACVQGRDGTEDQAGQAEEHRCPRDGDACITRDGAALQPKAGEALHVALLRQGRPHDRQAAAAAPGAPHGCLHHQVDRSVRTRDGGSQAHDPARPHTGEEHATGSGLARRRRRDEHPRELHAPQGESRQLCEHRADVRRGGEPPDRRSRDRRRRRPVRSRADQRSACRVPVGEARRAHVEPETDGQLAQSRRFDRAPAIDARPDARSRHPTSPWRPGEAGPVEAGKAPHRRRLAQLTARPPEWFVPAGLGVRGAGGDEEEVGEPVEVGEHERVDPVLLVRDERVALGSAARRARDVQARGCLRAARQDEALEHGQIGVELVAPLLEPIDRTLFDTQPVGDAEGNAEVGADVEEVVLDELEQPAQSLGQAGIGKHHTESSVQLVDGAERTDAAVELGNARAVAERGLAAVAGARVDAREANGLVAVPRAHRLLQIGTKPALSRARNAGSVERSGWWVKTPTRVGVFTRVRVYIKEIVTAPPARVPSGRGSSARSPGAGSRSSPRRSR